MFSLKALILIAAGALALPSNTNGIHDLLQARAGTPSSNGQHNGYYYSFWTDGGGTVNYQNGDKGNFAVNWKNCSNFYGGKGWKPGTSQTVNFNGTFTTSGNGYLSIYGWTTSPQTEYYIIESHGTYDPSKYVRVLGSYSSDGSVYKLARTSRIIYPPTSPLGAVQHQYYAVRQDKRTSGTVDVGNHVRVWQEKGLKLGKHDFQIVAVEGYQSSGEADVTVW
ncbi:glycoside hydrolase family 11 protein [Parathielavia appendiculata]|uniref:Endo-1,4-beta-xylanase n=1 Tax=Parathielavia appendiculata TaxID=2587402 RepID=A0AAN6YYC0_9PEZI|nr:glycoside hydrolase family 11 protein [Parathielavia appendiculata]